MHSGIATVWCEWNTNDNLSYPMLFGAILDVEINNEDDEGEADIDFEYKLTARNGKLFITIEDFEFQVDAYEEYRDEDLQDVVFRITETKELEYEGYDLIGTRGCYDIKIDAAIPTEIWNTINGSI